jgi:hypothetical protein
VPWQIQQRKKAIIALRMHDDEVEGGNGLASSLLAAIRTGVDPQGMKMY